MKRETMEQARKQFMQMALELAANGLGQVEPNPAVGAVIVKNERVIGIGWHKKFGAPHAEINALENCKKQGCNPKDATMFVTLEPCCHYGKTAPCTDALIAAGLKRIIVATLDPSKHANVRGVKQLRRAGIKVDVGLCKAEARILNAPFMKLAATGKPWITLKWAQSIDGKLARKIADPHNWISCKQSRKDARNLRRRADAILVGINTVLKDDPLLTPRPNLGKKPFRIVLDSRLRIPPDCQLLKTASDVPLLIVTQAATLRAKSKKAKQTLSRGAEILAYPQSVKSNLTFLLNHLSKRGIQHLLVEGGPTVIGSFLKQNLADEIIVYVAPCVLAATGCAEIAGALAKFDKSLRLHCLNIKRIGVDVRISGLTKSGLKSAVIS
jgi:diaminohydroxyphosphoribosylaminopyrimidine deaminase/5-amino-6-(5-phosphoribosylamino)uracil reductase